MSLVQIDSMTPSSPSTQNTVPLNENSNACSSAVIAPEKSPETHNEQAQRTALREISANTVDQVETVEQEQPTRSQDNTGKGDKGDEALGNIDEYVAQLLDKIEKQKAKAVKLCSVLEHKEKSQHVQDLANAFEEMNGTVNDENKPVDDCSKENKSPVKSAMVGLINVSPLKEKEIPKIQLSEVLHVSKTSINFGTKFPGQVVEESLDIVNKSDKDFVVRIEVDCLNEDLQDTEEYVFSVRRSHLHEYNDRHYLIMAPYSCASFKFALKVPNIKVNGDIEGQVRVSIEDVEGSYNLQLKAQAVIPKVYCPKELRLKGLGHSVIKLAVKEGKKQDFKIPIRNNGPVAVNLEMDFFEPSSEGDSEEKQVFDCIVHPCVLSVPANGGAQLNLVVKPKRNMGKEVEKNKTMRKVLVGRVRDTALMYTFVFGVEFF